MSDAALRTAERRWRETGAREDLQTLLANTRRMGVPVDYGLRTIEHNLYTTLGRNEQGLFEFRHKTTGMIFVQLPAGEFMMGPCDATVGDDETPQQVRRTFDEEFLIAKYPWTGREWHRVTGEFPSHFPTDEMVEEGRGITRMNDEPFSPETRMGLRDSDGRKWGDHPVESVSWDRCREVEDQINRIDFARAFNAPFQLNEDDKHWTKWHDYIHGIDDAPGAAVRSDGEVVVPHHALRFPDAVEPLYQAWLWNSDGERVGFQLPSEAMWEYAARAGTTTRYPSGDTDQDLEKIAWFGGDWDDGHKAVGLKAPNNWGLYDNCGNVFEWTRCMWQRNTETDPVNGFIAHGEKRPDPTATAFLPDSEIQRLVSAVTQRVEGTCPGPRPSEDDELTDASTQDSEQPGGPPFSSDPTQPTTYTEASTSTEEGSSSPQPSSTEPSEDPRTSTNEPPGSGSGGPPAFDLSDFTVPPGMDLSNLQPPNPDFYGEVTLDNLGGVVSSDPTQTHAERSSSDNTSGATSGPSTSSPSASDPMTGETQDDQSGMSSSPQSATSADPSEGVGGPVSPDPTTSKERPSSEGSAGSRTTSPSSNEAESGPGTSTRDSASEESGEPGSSDFSSAQGGRSTLSQSSMTAGAASSTSTSPRAETEQASSATRGIRSSIRESFTRLTSPFSSLLGRGATSDAAEAGDTTPTPSTTEAHSSHPASRPTGSDRPGGAGAENPFPPSSAHSALRTRSETSSPGSTSTETSSSQSSQQTPTTTPTTQSPSASSRREPGGIETSSIPLDGVTDPAEAGQSAHQQEQPGGGGDADFPSLTRSETSSSPRSTERSSATSPPSASESTSGRRGPRRTGWLQPRGCSARLQSSEAETGSGTIEQIPGGSIPNSPTGPPGRERHGERGDVNPTQASASRTGTSGAASLGSSPCPSLSEESPSIGLVTGRTSDPTKEQDHPASSPTSDAVDPSGGPPVEVSSVQVVPDAHPLGAELMVGSGPPGAQGGEPPAHPFPQEPSGATSRPTGSSYALAVSQRSGTSSQPPMPTQPDHPGSTSTEVEPGASPRPDQMIVTGESATPRTLHREFEAAGGLVSSDPPQGTDGDEPQRSSAQRATSPSSLTSLDTASDGEGVSPTSPTPQDSDAGGERDEPPFSLRAASEGPTTTPAPSATTTPARCDGAPQDAGELGRHTRSSYPISESLSGASSSIKGATDSDQPGERGDSDFPVSSTRSSSTESSPGSTNRSPDSCRTSTPPSSRSTTPSGSSARTSSPSSSTTPTSDSIIPGPSFGETAATTTPLILGIADPVIGATPTESAASDPPGEPVEISTVEEFVEVFGHPDPTSPSVSHEPCSEDIDSASSALLKALETTSISQALAEPSLTQTYTTAPATSSEGSAGSATPPQSPSEILDTIERMRTELQPERPGGAAPSLAFPGAYIDKWAPLLDKVDDKLVQGLTAAMLENEVRYLEQLRDEPVGPFLRFTFPLIRAPFPNLISHHLVNPQSDSDFDYLRRLCGFGSWCTAPGYLDDDARQGHRQRDRGSGLRGAWRSRA